MTPTISVLIPCHNAAPFVAQTLQSLATQTFRDFEIIIVDDGSTDGSSAIIRSLAHKHTKLISQSRRGASAARNKALHHSSGDFVLFLDADDLIAPEHLECLYDRVKNAPSSVALSKWDRFTASPAEATFPNRPTECDLSGPDWVELDWRDARPMTQPGMLLLPRTLLDQLGAWDERLSLADDFEFFARILTNAEAVLFAPRAHLSYRSALTDSLSMQASRRAVESAFLSLNLGTQHLLAAKDTPETRRVCANLLQDFQYRYFPAHKDLRQRALARVAELGGSNLEPDGPPGFHFLRRLIGWRAARIVQRMAESLRLNRAARAQWWPWFHRQDAAHLSVH